MNPNEYDDERYASASSELAAAIEELWESGISEDEIRSEFEQFLKDIVS